MYELYTRTAANGSSQIEGIDFEASYSPTSFWENIRFLLAIAAAQRMKIFTIDVSNAFQTNIEEQQKDCIWLSIPPFYLEWFSARYPDHPLRGTPANQLCLQNIRTFQGTKDAGRKWYRLLNCIFENELDLI